MKREKCIKVKATVFNCPFYYPYPVLNLNQGKRNTGKDDINEKYSTGNVDITCNSGYAKTCNIRSGVRSGCIFCETYDVYHKRMLIFCLPLIN